MKEDYHTEVEYLRKDFSSYGLINKFRNRVCEQVMKSQLNEFKYTRHEHEHEQPQLVYCQGELDEDGKLALLTCIAKVWADVQQERE